MAKRRGGGGAARVAGGPGGGGGARRNRALGRQFGRMGAQAAANAAGAGRRGMDRIAAQQRARQQAVGGGSR